ncbi:MAG: hypothetical protein KKD63_16780, partial [Proteobacteria bacterium]|nr:hypothetical protein [Pseudomonadota bacterium]
FHLKPELAQPFDQFFTKPFRVRLVLKADDKSSRAGESHPHALSEPDVKLSPHPAPTVQPLV